MWWIGVSSLAWGQPKAVEWPEPNVIVGVSAGRPAAIALRAEAWLADQLSAEVGFGLPRFDVETLSADLTLRLRPDLFCVGCGRRDLLVVGVGLAGVGTADADFDDWRLVVGPDVAVTGVHWFTPELGLQATVRGGLGPVLGPDASFEAVDWWTFGSLGLSF